MVMYVCRLVSLALAFAMLHVVSLAAQDKPVVDTSLDAVMLKGREWMAKPRVGLASLNFAHHGAKSKFRSHDS